MNKILLSSDIQTLLHKRSEICISIIMPTHQLSPGRLTDQTALSNTIQEVKSGLLKDYDNATVTPLIRAIDELYEQIDFMHSAAGLGIFVSAHVKKLISFFHPVTERVTIAQLFDIRDLIYESYYNIPYVVLSLSQKETKLFKAHLNMLTQITDGNFPQKNETEYDYSRPTRSSTGHTFVKEIEKDKSVMEEIRIKSFFRETNKMLNNYLDSYLNHFTHLIITGENQDLSYFKQITTHAHNTVCNISGNYANFNEHELGALTWKAMKAFLDLKKEKLILDFKEKIGQGLGITGLNNIWKAVQEGRGYKLLVEKDYSTPGYLPINDTYDLYLNEPKQPYRKLPDIVNNIIETVLEKNGEVIMMENDAIRDCRRMALITRY